MSDLAIIGRAERIVLPDHDTMAIPAKVDTGADSSSIWASDIKRHENNLQFVLFAPGSEYYTGQVIEVAADNFRRTRVASSSGHLQVRYAVKLPIKVLNKTIRATFTLADRTGRTYPILLGRRTLKNKFLVDVTKGQPLATEEKAKRNAMSIALNELED